MKEKLLAMNDSEKNPEHSALHSAILRVASEMRGIVHGRDLVQYVLGLLLYRFISENLCSKLNKKVNKVGRKKFNYAALSNTEAERILNLVAGETDFLILPDELFENVQKHASNNANLDKTLEAVFRNIVASTQGKDSQNKVSGLFDDLAFDGKKFGTTVAERHENLVKMLNAIADLPVGKNGKNPMDSYGIVSEFLMDKYAANAGILGGEHFTPQAVSELLVRITLINRQEVNKVYDPACGSGLLLLKFANVLGKENVRNGFFGQEIKNKNYNHCRMNILLHDIDPEQFDIAQGDTLTDPYHQNVRPFDAIVSNPPFSVNWEGDSNPKLTNDSRFSPAGVLAPKSKADMAFAMHAHSWLDMNGTAAIVSYPGVMQRAGAEQKIRKYLVDNNYVDAVIQLPADLFYGSTIAFCILVMKKKKPDNKVLFIDAKKQFEPGTEKNTLNHNHLRKILECYENRESHDYFSRLVENEEIAANDYDFSVRNYVEPEDSRVSINIEEIKTGIEASAIRQSEIRKQIDVIVDDLEKTGIGKIDELISLHCNNGVEYRELQDIFEIRKGSFRPPNKKVQKIGTVHLFRTGDIQKSGVILCESEQKIAEEDIKDLQLFPANSIIISTSSVKVKHALITIPHLAYQNLTSLSLKPEYSKQLDMRFVNHYCFLLDNWCVANKASTNKFFSNINMAEFRRFKFAIPPLPVQKEIVGILDSFTQISSQLEEELETELDAHRKKHDYYLNSVLAFQKIGGKVKRTAS